jgi:C4-dicarboxylate transporter
MDAETLLLEVMKEENTHARHTESQRLEVTKFLLTGVGILIAFMGTLKFSIYCLPFGFLIVALGYIGKTINHTYVTRFDDHRTRARACRAQMDALAVPANLTIPLIRANPMTKTNSARVRTFWSQINNGVIIIGLICILCNAVSVIIKAANGNPCIPFETRILNQLAT